jgi:LytS/YehU family sensor histidine kinase
LTDKTLIPQLLFFLLYAIHFYSVAFAVLPAYKGKWRYFKLVSGIIINYTGFLTLNFLIVKLFASKYSDGTTVELFTWQFVKLFSSYYFQYGFYAVIYYYITQLIKRQQQLEKEKLKFELDFLRAQINPHFLYNSFNAFSSRTTKYNIELAQRIKDFSDVMRYSIEAPGTDGRVEAEQELENVQRLLNIHNFNHFNQLQIQYKEIGQMGGRIPPHIFLTLAENAVKHADLLDPAHPLQITVESPDDKDLLIFCVHNKKKNPKYRTGGMGIGMDNLTKRLRNEYGKDYLLKIDEDDQFYTAKLTLVI